MEGSYVATSGMESISATDLCRRDENGGPLEVTGKQADGGEGDQAQKGKNEIEDARATGAHVLVFPFPMQGYINSMLRLAELLCLSGIEHLTFVNTDRNQRLHMANNRQMSRSHHPGIRFKTISDGLPDGDYGAGTDPDSHAWDLHQSLAAVFPQQLPSLLEDRKSSGNFHEHIGSEVNSNELLPPVTCAIVDGLMSFAIDACLEAAIPVVAFRTISACSFWVYYSVADLIQAGELPFPASGERCDMDEAITSIPGMQAGLLRRRDLPVQARVKDIKDGSTLQRLQRETRNTSRATALLLNTVETMESPVLSVIRSEIPDTFAVGPIHALLQHIRTTNALNSISEDSLQDLRPKANVEQASRNNNHRISTRMSLWEEESSCIAWLDEQPPKSVVYVSFGSLTVMTRGQALEFWHGLLASGHRFLWVVRSDALIDAADGDSKMGPCTVVDNNGNDFQRGTRTTFIPPTENDNQQRRYLLVNWAPQEEVLNHPSVGGFFTHSGWNSTLESAIAGVPMLCWPYFADQHVNSRFVEHVWKVGIDIKDICDRDTVAGAVRSLMQGLKARELRANATKLAEEVMAAVAPGGSSYCQFKKLVQCIKLGDFSR